MPIPKKIHQTYRTKDGLSVSIRGNISRLKQLNPGWEYTFYDDADVVEFIRKHYSPEILSLYNKINPTHGAARADLFRYLLIYKVGGAYLDLKSSITAPFERIAQGKDYVLTHWAKRPAGMFENDADFPWGEYQQWHVIGAPEHPYLKAVIDLVLDNIENYSYQRVTHPGLDTIRTTGPVPYTIAINPIREQHSHQLYRRNKDGGLTYSIFPKMDHRAAIYKDRKLHYSELRSPVVLHANAANYPQINARISSHG